MPPPTLIAKRPTSVCFGNLPWQRRVDGMTGRMPSSTVRVLHTGNSDISHWSQNHYRHRCRHHPHARLAVICERQRANKQSFIDEHEQRTLKQCRRHVCRKDRMSACTTAAVRQQVNYETAAAGKVAVGFASKFLARTEMMAMAFNGCPTKGYNGQGKRERERKRDYYWSHSSRCAS